MTLNTILLLGFSVGFILGAADNQEPVAYQIFKKSGEFMIGGLFPVHTTVSDSGSHWKPEPVKCKSLNPTGFLQALAMRFTLEEINNSTTLLPGESLGYEMYDTCLNSLVIIHPVLRFLTRDGTENIEIQCNLTEYRTKVMAVIGPSSTEIATASMKLLSTLLIPQISYSVSADIFSDKSIYPSFYRTVPSDKKQVEGMVALISYFKWNWIAAVASEDDYGETALRQFSSTAMANGICIAYEGLIPLYLSGTETRMAIEDMLDKIEQTDVKVVLVFATLTQSIAFFQEVIMRNMTKVWIGSASWVLSQSILSLPGIERVGTVIGFFPSAQTVSGFGQYLKKVVSEMYPDQSSFQSTSTQSSANYRGIDFEVDKLPAILHPVTELYAQSVYTAVYSVAHALHNLLNCDSVKCNKKNTTIYPWKLLEEVRKVNFTIFNTTFGFDKNGNPNTGYDIVTHSLTDVGFTKIGSYNNVMDLNTSLIDWGTKANKVPESQCSGDCLPGQIKRVKGTHSCCFDCIDCQEGMFHSPADNYECYPCPSGQWSNTRSMDCSDPTYLYLKWTDISVIVLLLLTCILLFLVLGTLILFVKNRNIAIVQASGGNMSLFALISLLAVGTSMFFFIGKPTLTMCQIQQPLLSIGFTCCLSTFSVKALQVMLVTDFKGVPSKYIQFLKTQGTWASVIFSILLQCLFCMWHIQSNQHLTPDEQVTFLSKYLKCEISNVLSFSLMFGYNGILALMSFMLNCVAQAPPGQYNLARDITFSMLAYLLIWIVFVPCYAELTDGNQPLLQMIVTLVSSFGIMLGYFFPKCYILLVKPEMGTEEYFKIYNN